MWTGVERLSQQVTQYGTVFGQLWYLTVFVFRLIVVVSIGTSVYTDEQTAFRCSTKVLGCDNVCYDRFSKISHIRYWSFQLLAVTAPTVLFHFYSSRIKGQIEKIKKAEEQQAAADPGQTENRREIKKLIRRRKSVGDFRVRPVLDAGGTKLEELTTTRQIQIAYYMTVILRAVVEGVSLVLTYKLFHFADYTVEPSTNPLSSILIRVPQVYRCAGENVEWACGQHMSLGDDMVGYVPCWVSRPWEKTIFMCYMNFLSLFCLIISVIELFQLSGRVCIHRYSSIRRQQRLKIKNQRFSDASIVSNRGDIELNRVSEVDGSPPVYNLAVSVPVREIGEYQDTENERRGRKRNRKGHHHHHHHEKAPFEVKLTSSDDEVYEKEDAGKKE